MKRVRVTSLPTRDSWLAEAATRSRTDGRPVRTWEEAGDFMLSVRHALDQAKYQEFLDTLGQVNSIGTRGIMDRMTVLLRGHPNLKQHFNLFLPPPYQISLSDDNQQEEAPGADNLQVQGRSGQRD